MSVDAAIMAYRNKFRDKTRKGEYVEIELNFGDDE